MKYFAAALGLAISTTTISYISIFPALYLLQVEVSRGTASVLGAGW